jgi:hypothetical protein
VGLILFSAPCSGGNNQSETTTTPIQADECSSVLALNGLDVVRLDLFPKFLISQRSKISYFKEYFMKLMVLGV